MPLSQRLGRAFSRPLKWYSLPVLVVVLLAGLLLDFWKEKVLALAVTLANIALLAMLTPVLEWASLNPGWALGLLITVFFCGLFGYDYWVEGSKSPADGYSSKPIADVGLPTARPGERGQRSGFWQGSHYVFDDPLQVHVCIAPVQSDNSSFNFTVDWVEIGAQVTYRIDSDGPQHLYRATLNDKEARTLVTPAAEKRQVEMMERLKRQYGRKQSPLEEAFRHTPYTTQESKGTILVESKTFTLYVKNDSTTPSTIRVYFTSWSRQT